MIANICFAQSPPPPTHMINFFLNGGPIAKMVEKAPTWGGRLLEILNQMYFNRKQNLPMDILVATWEFRKLKKGYLEMQEKRFFLMRMIIKGILLR